ncbi:MAG: radical SAM protein [Pseudonocardiales bacterium]
MYHEAAVDVRYWSLISRCKHCYMGQRLDRALKMPFEKVARTLEMWRLMGGWKLTILGGEPTLHPDYIRIIRLAKQFGYEHVITTSNGLIEPAPGELPC